MSSKRKTFGIAAIAVVAAIAAVAMLATSALVATAEETTSELTAEEYPATLHAVGEKHTFVFEGRTVTCQNATSEGLLTKAASEVEYTPKYSNCTATIGGKVLPATVTFPCIYKETHTGKVNDHTFTIEIDLICPAGQHVQTHVYKAGTEHKLENEVCTFTKGSEANVKVTVVHNRTTPPRTVDATVESSEFEYTRVQGTEADCGPASGTGTSTGNTVIAGYNKSKKQIGIDVSE